MATPLDEVRRLRAELERRQAELAQRGTELAQLHTLVNAHLQATGHEIDTDHGRLLASEARAAGHQEGWDACLDRFADQIGGRIYPAHPTELEQQRWGPGGREHFADPRPGDYPGGPVAWEPTVREPHPKAEPEREAG
jgi:hypothetical protein